MQEYRIGTAIVRIHGNPNRDSLESATVKFLKEVQRRKKVQRSKTESDRQGISES